MNPGKDISGPARRCIISGESAPAEEMLRFVVSPAGELVFDAKGTLPGRGLWLSPSSAMLLRAKGQDGSEGRLEGAIAKAAARAARARVVVPDDLFLQVERALVAGTMGALSLAKRAGQVTQGFEKVHARLKKGPAGLVIGASDGAPDGLEKIRALAAKAAAGTPLVMLFGREELARATGREEAVHLVVEPGGLAEKIIGHATRLAALKGQSLDAKENERKR